MLKEGLGLVTMNSIYTLNSIRISYITNFTAFCYCGYQFLLSQNASKVCGLKGSMSAVGKLVVEMSLERYGQITPSPVLFSLKYKGILLLKVTLFKTFMSRITWIKAFKCSCNKCSYIKNTHTQFFKLIVTNNF